ncbi:hypothetical protein D3C78_870050 [compost metagenome]
MFDEFADQIHALQAGFVFPACIPIHAGNVARSLGRFRCGKVCIVVFVVGFIEENTAIRQLLSVHSFISATSGVSQPRCWPPSSAIICPVTDGVSKRKRIVRPNSSGAGPRFNIRPSICA